MKQRKPSRKQMRTLCEALGPEDGLDPRYDRPSAPQRRASRKARQVCTQAARTLQSVLSGESGDDVLRELTVLSVTPAPHASRLLVTVSLASSDSKVDAATVLERLRHAAGRLRSEVAAAVNRRRAPELTFQVAARSPSAPR